MRIFISMTLLFFVKTLSAQNDFSGQDEYFHKPGDKNNIVQLEKSNDTVGLGNSISVSIIIENASLKKTIKPTFDGFDVQGPSISNSMTYVNGVSSQSCTYSYQLNPKTTGVFDITSIKVETDKGTFSTAPTKVIVLENYISTKPQRNQNRSFFNDDFFGMQHSPFQNAKPKPRNSQPLQKKKNYSTEDL